MKSSFRKSLSLVAAVTVAPNLVAKTSFQSLVNSARQPYARIGPKLPQETSTELLCSAGTDEMRKRWSPHCSATGNKLELLGKVVVIGSENEVDHWIVLGRRMWGFQLQAQFVLLRYLPPLLLLSAVLIILVSRLAFAGLEHSKHMILPEE